MRSYEQAEGASDREDWGAPGDLGHPTRPGEDAPSGPGPDAGGPPDLRPPGVPPRGRRRKRRRRGEPRGVSLVRAVLRAGLVPAEVTLHGRVLVRDHRRVVLEVVLARALHWAPVDPITVLLADGTWVVATLEPSTTTRPERMTAGTSVRLTLQVPGPDQAVTEVRLSSANCALRIVL
jgi:hypothetical protein